MTRPDKWIIVKMNGAPFKENDYRIFCTWYGGYLGSDSWRMNSGIAAIEETDVTWDFIGRSGSLYQCHKEGYGLSGYGASVLHGLNKDIEEENCSIVPVPKDKYLELINELKGD